MTTVEQLIREAAGLDAVKIEKTASKSIDLNEAKKVSTGLQKLASLPYKEDVYNSVKEIMKIASESIDSMVAELSEKTAELENLVKVSEVREIIDTMIDKGIIGKHDIQEKTAELIKKSGRDLEIVKEAIMLNGTASKNIFFEDSEKTASVSPDSKRGIFDGVDGLVQTGY
jgi:hypothetical protein